MRKKTKKKKKKLQTAGGVGICRESRKIWHEQGYEYTVGPEYGL
jgi:hypothetical protein